MKLELIHEANLSDIGHTALDVAGLVPGIGEPADLANALWHAKKGEYVSSLLSLVSLIPTVGDAIGKGAKYTPKLAKKIGPALQKYWPKIKAGIEGMEKWKPFIEELEKAAIEIIQQNNSKRNAAERTPARPSIS